MEDSQKKSVESVLEDLQHLIRSPLFQKDQAIDYLVNLKIVAKETKHAKAGFYSAVLTAMQNKMWASNMQFKRYLEALLGDKEDEVVLKRIAAVDKALRVPGVGANRFMPRGRGRDRSQVQCFQCGLYGHYQRFCSSRPQPGPQSKRPRLIIKELRHLKNNECIDRIKAFSQCFLISFQYLCRVFLGIKGSLFIVSIGVCCCFNFNSLL